MMSATDLLGQEARMTIPDLRPDMEGLFTQWDTRSYLLRMMGCTIYKRECETVEWMI
jgi:hypothetical protein